MTRCVPAALLLLLVAGPAGGTERHYRVRDSVYGCVDPRATVGLSGRDGFLHRDGWSAAERRTGRCFLLTPRLQLEVISRRADLALLRRVPPRAGEPPLYAMTQDLRVIAAPASLPTMAAAVALRMQPMSGMAAGESASRPVATPVMAARTGTDVGAPMAAGAAPTQEGSAVGGISSPGMGTVQVPPAGEAVSGKATPAPGFSSATMSARPGAGAVTTEAAPVGGAPVPVIVATPAASASAGPGANSPVQPVARAAEGAAASAPKSSEVVHATPAQAEPDAAPSSAATVQPAAWPPPKLVHAPRGLLSSVLVTLLLMPFVIGALMVARRRRHFAHVEDGLPARDQPRTASLPVPGGPAPLASLQMFRQGCAEALQEAGWTTKLTFPGDGSGPDIVGRRGDSVIAVRCRVAGTAITGEMVDEAAAMGARHGGSMTVLASNAPFSQRARDEASRQRVHLLRDTELDTFTG